MTLTCELTPLAERPVAAVLQMLPQSFDVLEDADIDFSCGGGKSLAEAAVAAGYDVDELINLIESRPLPPDAVDWSQRPLADLTEYLVADHKDLALRRVPELREIVERDIARRPHVIELRRIAALLSNFASTVTTHMAHEERDLFPWIASAERGTVIRLGQRVLREHVEHKILRERLRTMRELACRVRAGDGELYPALRKFSRSIHEHMHLENNILYPRAIEIENRLHRAG